MEETPEGLATAAATREAAKRKRAELEAQGVIDDQPVAKKSVAPPQAISHEVALPENYVCEIDAQPELYGSLQHPQWKGRMAKQYPFKLDPFQSTSVACLERRESVLVAAHTSAGKTAVAEYAIAMAFRDNQKVIYTSPLKALSNQKFRELCDEFDDDVGLMTGDVSIRPNATCVVMTTEILRSMLYRGSEILREVAWVIFDEVHYMQDRERGVVWEEAIIFLPKGIRMVFLSATLSNASEFAGWVCHLHKQPCHVVYTDFRPTPLQHYAFPAGGSGLYLIKDEQGNFKTENFSELRHVAFNITDQNGNADGEKPATAAPARDEGGGRGRGRGRAGRGGRGGRGQGGPSASEDVYKIVKLIKARNFQPVIVFSFNRRECEQSALFMRNKELNFNSSEEEESVALIFKQAMQCLKEEDRELQFIDSLLPLLKRGIGVHHSGLLPILKEVIELLFQEQLIKCLFATETFAMGLNMPATTCVFTSMRKWDGESNRWVKSGEYIQMSGRAGRRGKDDRGVCIMMVDESMDAFTCKEIVTGKPSPLLSSFKLSYYTLLNLMRRMENTGQNMEYVIQHSFQQYQFERALPDKQAEVARLEGAAASITLATEEQYAQYQQLKQDIARYETVMLSAIQQPTACLHFLRPGRLVRIREGALDWGWGIIVSVMRKAVAVNAGVQAEDLGPASAYILDVLLSCDAASVKAGRPMPLSKDGNAEMHVLPVPLTLLSAISTLRVSLPNDLRQPEPRRSTLLTLKELEKRYEHGLPRLDPVEDMNIAEPAVNSAVRRIEQLEQQLSTNEVFKAERDAKRYTAFEKKAGLTAQAERLKTSMKESQLVNFRAETKSRSQVLRKLGMIDGEGMVTLKGRAACEIDTADELLTTEMMFNGTFNGLDKHQLVALVSCLVPGEKSQEQIQLTKALSEPLSQLQQTARNIAEISQECKLQVEPDEYVESFKPFSMDITYHWSKGASFGDICRMTDKFEGCVVREMRRLDELMKNLHLAAKVVGDVDLAAKFEESALTIRRDIVFAASLYI